MDFRKGGKVKKETFDRDIPYETSKNWEVLHDALIPKKTED